MTQGIRVALVTGAASGLGRLSCERLAAGGAQVAALDVDDASLTQATRGQRTVRPFLCDVTDAARLRQIADEVERSLGPIDRVVHAAAIMPGAALLDQGTDVTSRVMRVNYEGTVNVVHATLPRLLERGHGQWIGFGSVAGYALTPRLGAYCASKAAVNAYLEVLIRETAGRGVCVHLSCPPMVDTPLLKQALDSGPKSLSVAIERKLLASPASVLDAIDAAVARGESISYPLPMAKWLYAMRRLSPGLLWRVIERSERAS
jgi:NAD(P)-dependent dehydrogenase (short-subunit alcohol dehydrogenase family)